MHFLCASDRIGRGFGQAKVTDLADLNQLGHGTNGVLDGRIGINPVLIVEIDHVDLQPAQGCLAGRTHIIGLSIDTDKRAIRRQDIAELGCEHNLAAAIFNGFSNQLFIPTPLAAIRGRIAEYLPLMMYTRNMLRCAKWHSVNPSDGLEFLSSSRWS